MTSRIPLPSGLGDRPFTTRTAAERGIGEGRLRGPDLARPFHGIRSLAAATSLPDQARALQLRLPEAGFFCGVTAALIIGIPLPSRLRRPPELHVGTRSPLRACKAAGTTGHKLQLRDGDLRDWRGLRVTTAARTWCDLAAILDVEDLVAAGDYLIHREHPLASRAELENAVARHPSRRRRALLVEALGLLDENAESPPESIIRVTVVRAGITGLRANFAITDARGHEFARGDLCFPAHRVIFEYQGDYHRSEPERWRKDRTRAARLAAAGWHIVEIAADELIDRRMLLRIIRDTLALYPARFAL
ncbi:hypothetical protein E3T26_11710 [Cryobacterium sp. TMT1-21]|uniref:DUF559 domain-containing protein n=1 Tax=Cryobacterium shii TaxID=1259235 RepID=A0AAQ2C4X0_9MICO|nr:MULTISPECIES: hypothetical protein [Cryobacterium]TFC43875.1 hypothetical protein E3O49_12315 [Cryobacterium shii]TFD12265.1 hypothetical protein E3T26_11710 [Cryobacterium sp. TMT1-21]TFD35894.1 hypothetical protein E3T37_14515 [Cryobacterium sp. TMT2-10]